MYRNVEYVSVNNWCDYWLRLSSHQSQTLKKAVQLWTTCEGLCGSYSCTGFVFFLPITLRVKATYIDLVAAFWSSQAVPRLSTRRELEVFG